MDSGGSSNFKGVGAGVTDSVVSDGSATYTPGISERRSSTTTYLSSGLKTLDQRTNSSQTDSGTRRYDAFGAVVSSSGSWASPWGYAGKFGYQEDADAGYQLLGHRYYDASTGRFLTRDPVKDGRNWYSYCGNSPINRADPNGCFFKELLLSIWQAPQQVIGAIGAIGGRVVDVDEEGCNVIVQGGWLANTMAALGLADAVTFGDYILVRNEGVSAAVLAHERGHTDQSAWTGPLYLPATGFSYVIGFGKDLWWGGDHSQASIHDASPLEADADARSDYQENVDRNWYIQKVWLGLR